MKDLISSFLFTGLGLFLFSIAMNIVRFYLGRRKHNSGISYGMVVNSKTGKITPQQRNTYH